MSTKFAPGRVLGRYELLVPVGRGGMAEVWAARLRGSRGFQKIVALKVMLPYLADDPNFERMFLDEASLASQVRHPNVIEILDLGEQEDVLYLVMEWVDGEPLNVVLEELAGSPLPMPIATGIALQTCAGLQAVHDLRGEDGSPVGLVHRDVSPQNLLVGYDGRVKIVDFGVAKATLRRSEQTKQGQLKGKFAYMAPEQLRGEQIDQRADVFALGTVLYTMTTGRHPFKGENEAVTITNVAGDEPAELPSRLVAGFPRALEAVVLAAVAKDRDRRFATMDQFRDALLRAVGAETPATADDIAAFLATVLSGRHAERRAALRRALDDADSRGSSMDAPLNSSAFATLTRAGTSLEAATAAAPRSGTKLVWVTAVAFAGLVAIVAGAFALHGAFQQAPRPAAIGSAAAAAPASSAFSPPEQSASAPVPTDETLAAASAIPVTELRLADAGADASSDAGAKPPPKRRVRRIIRRRVIRRTPKPKRLKPSEVLQDPGF